MLLFIVLRRLNKFGPNLLNVDDNFRCQQEPPISLPEIVILITVQTQTLL